MTESKGNYLTADNWKSGDEQELNAVQNSLAIFRRMVERYEKRETELLDRMEKGQAVPTVKQMKKQKIKSSAESIKDYAEQIVRIIDSLHGEING
mgnify:CR=1 FL=1